MDTVTITMPADLLDETQKAARQQDRSVSEFVQAAVRRYLVSNEEWRALLERTQAHGRAMGITSEEDVERLSDEWRREQASKA
jgi:metal-responsive CopG/Arc/MetJ family transcriptional regulator